jgi:hypothetical protein
MAKADTRTGLEKFRDELEEKQGRRITQKNIGDAFGIVYRRLSNNPEAQEILKKALEPNGVLTPANKALIGQTLFKLEASRAALENPNIAKSKDLDRKSQFAGLLTVFSSVNSVLNVASRISLGAGAYNAQVAGRAIEFENQQRTWENIKRTSLLAGSAGSTAYFTLKAASGVGVNFFTGLAVVAAAASQGARIFNENKQLSGERRRQDLDAQYHQMTYGRIITRGNR